MSSARPDSPLVSILMPVRDAAPTLREAVASCLGQSYPEFELIAVDDGSRDGSRALLKEYARRDGRVRVLETRDNKRGLVPALQLAASQARGSLLARMDADDVSRADRLARQVEFLERRPDVAVAGCRVRIVGLNYRPSPTGGGIPAARGANASIPQEAVAVDAARAQIDRKAEDESPRRGFPRYERWINSLCEPEEIARARFIESPLVHPSVMMRREAFERAGGYRDPPWAEDYDLWLRMLELGMRLAKVPETLLDWRDRPDRLTRAAERYSQANFLRAKAHYLARISQVRERGAIVSGAGEAGKTIARYLRTEGIEIRAFIDVHPRRIGKMIHGAPVLGPEQTPPASPLAPVQLGATGKYGRRDQVRAMLAPLGYIEGVDFFCVC